MATLRYEEGMPWNRLGRLQKLAGVRGLLFGGNVRISAQIKGQPLDW
jgi:hypothetical protein